MPTLTRAALRSNTILPDSILTDAISTPLPSTPVIARAPLGEISGNNTEDTTMPAATLDFKKNTNTGASKAKKGKAGKKPKTQAPMNDKEESTPEVMEDDNQSATSEAVEDACEDLLKGSDGVIHQVPMHDERPITPPSQAVRAARKELSPEPQTPRFEPELCTLGESEGKRKSAGEEEDDSFVRTIGSRTPAKMTRDETLEKDEDEVETTGEDARKAKEDSFLEQIVSRSPAKSITRIEDSVEAIDALEDAIELVGDALPTVGEHKSLVKTKKVKPATSEPGHLKKTSGHSKAAAPQKQAKTTVPAKASSAKKTTTVTRARISVTKTVSKPAPKPTLSNTRLSIRPTALTAKASSPTPTNPNPNPPPTTTKPPTTETRALSKTHNKTPFQPQKSTKPPTRPTFALPGEAISRKLKEQRESRLKLEEEEKQKAREFKARPVRLSHAPVVKPTAASRARASLLHLEGGGGVSGGNDGAPRIKPLVRASSVGEGDDKAARRESTLSVAKRQSVANPSAPRAPSFVGSTISRNPSTTGPGGKATVTAAEVAQQKLRAREIFGRDRLEKEERERVRREKEDAAKRARAEAAERGRVASREWAERKKGRKVGGAGGEGEGKGKVDHVVPA
ncbi:MAG: hypothetical protein M1830_002458 [Pleopsidium flavum]|nr:MAG: hypothetical protein M1830_002458 [Pleopsidium flavum]